MESVKNIEKLLERYLEAETTVAEEARLQEYFLQEDIPAHLESYRPMFQYFKVAKQERYTKEVPLKPGRNTSYYLRWVSVAAVAVLLVGVYFNQQPLTSSTDQFASLEEEYTPEEIESAQMALAMFSKNFNKGTEGVAYLKEFEKTTNKFLVNE
ncbi:hypothetical protein [Robertkochia flava]|uniref:hypothetical protein n=1 Tax=Robertkochia flava TaxID=3447986 RepID=UPI001CCE13BB|nr:hypothetical protein [Robertkochia marina]